MPASDPTPSERIEATKMLAGVLLTLDTKDVLEGLWPGFTRKMLISDIKAEMWFWRFVRWIEGCDTLPGEALCQVMLEKLKLARNVSP